MEFSDKIFEQHPKCGEKTFNILKELFLIETHFIQHITRLKKGITYLEKYLPNTLYFEIKELIDPCLQALKKIKSFTANIELDTDIEQSDFDNIIKTLYKNSQKYADLRIKAFTICSQKYSQITLRRKETSKKTLLQEIESFFQTHQPMLDERHKNFFKMMPTDDNQDGDPIVFFTSTIAPLFQQIVRYEMLLSALFESYGKDLRKQNLNSIELTIVDSISHNSPSSNGQLIREIVTNSNNYNSRIFNYIYLYSLKEQMKACTASVNFTMGLKSTEVLVANIIRISHYYLNTESAHKLFLNKTLNTIKKKWQPQLSKLLHTTLRIYFDKEEKNKTQKVFDAISKTLKEIYNSSHGKNSRLAGSLAQLIQGYDLSLSVSKKALPQDILNFKISSEEAIKYIAQEKFANPSNICLAAKTLQYLDYYQHSRAGRLLTKQIKKEKKVKNCHAFISEQAEKKINKLRRFILSALSKNKPAADILFEIDETIKKIKSSFRVTENDKDFANALSYISTEYGGVSNCYKKIDIIPEAILDLNITSDAAYHYINDYYLNSLPPQDNPQPNRTNNADDSLLENIIKITDYYLKNRTNGSWYELAKTVNKEILDIKNNKVNISQEHLLMYIKDIARKIRNQSYFGFWGGVNSSLANTLETLHGIYSHPSESKNPEYSKISFMKKLLPVELTTSPEATEFSESELTI